MTPDRPGDLELLEALYLEVKGVARDLRPADVLRDDLGLDSLALAELVTRLEDELRVSLVDDERLPSARRVSDVLELLSTARPR